MKASSVYSSIVVGLLLAAASSAFATATVTTATGGGAISADTAGGTYTALGNIVLTEGANRDINTGTIVLSAPTGFAFDTTASSVTVTVTRVAGTGTAVALTGGSPLNVTPAASAITITVSGRDTSDAATKSSITWAGIKVRPTAGTPLASGNITDTGSASISGITLSSSSFGALAEVAGAANKLAFTTQPTNATAGVTMANVAVQIRDQFGNNVSQGGTAITLTLTGSTLSSGTNPQNTDATGKATFNNLVIQQAGTGLTFAAAGGSLTGTTSSSFNITPAAIASYVVSAATPRAAGGAFATTVTAKDSFNNTVTTDSSTVVTMTGTGSVQFDSNGDGTYGDNTKTLSNGTFTIPTRDNAAETITITATSSGPKTGTSGSVVINGLRTVWLYRKAITLDHTKVSADQTSFPVLINLASDASLAAHARSDGFDLLFTSGDGATVLPYQREQYTSATGALVAWVKVPTLSSTADTVLYLYYGNAAAIDQQAAASVWDSNYRSVWHLKESPVGTAPQMKDSTASANSGTTSNAFVAGDQQAAKIDGGLHFGGAAGYDVTVANEPNFDFEYNSSFSIEYWAKPVTTDTVKKTPVSKVQNSGVFPGYEIGHNVNGPGGTNTPGKVRIILVNSATGTKHQVVVSSANVTKLNDGGWHHYVYTYSGTGTAAGVKIYEDGVSLATTIDEDDLASNSILNATPVHLGSRENGGLYYNGLLDEVRISAAARSATWIATEWTNQAAPASFYSVGTEQSPATTTLVSSSLNPSTYGQTVTFTAAVTSSAGTPSGTVTFLDGATTLGTGTLSSGQATLNVTSFAAGSHAITVQYAGDITFSASTGTLAGGQTVNQATPVITWANPADILYGTALSGAQLNATASVPGTLVYSPLAGTVLTVGTHQALTVNFTPTDAVNYQAASATVYLNVNQATPVITWANPADILYGMALSGTQLDATASVPGTLVYSPLAGTVLSVGAHQALTVNFTPTDAVNYQAASATVYLNVNQATPAITWANPADITYGTALSGTQLNATVSVPGTLVYSPLAATVLSVGTHQALTVNFTPTDTANYNVASATVYINVGSASLTVAGVEAESRGYDGTTNATLIVSNAVLVGVVSGDTVTLDTTNATGAFGDKNVGTGKTVTVSGLALLGADAAKYTLTPPTTNADITAVALSVTGVTANSKPYDGNSTATLGGTAGLSAGVVGSEDVTLGGTPVATFDNKNVGTGKPVTVSGYALAGADIGNYTLSQPAGLVADISPIALSVTGVTANSKPYDGNTTATLGGTAGLSAGVVGSEDVTLSGTPVATFDNKNVGTGKPVTVSGYALAGADIGNYTLSQPAGLVADISPIALSVTGVTANSKPYDGNTTATLGGSAALSSGVVGSEDVTLGGTPVAAFNNKNVGTGKPVTVNGYALAGGDIGNYTLSQPAGLAADISPIALSVTGVTANSKPYDGNTTATLGGSAALSSGVVGSEDVTLGGTPVAAFNNKNVGTGKPVTASGYALAGGDIGNYTLSQPTGLSADITMKGLSVTGITASNKAYDGDTTATLNTTGAALAGKVGGDDVALNPAGATGAFADASVGTGKTVYVSGLTVSGGDIGNYSLTQPTTTADITLAGLTVTGVEAESRGYDGTTNATLIVSNAALVGVISGDTVTLDTTNATGAFGDKTVGTGKTVTVSGLALLGADAAKYTLTQPTTNADITPAALSVTGVAAVTRFYDGSTVATLSGTAGLSGLVSGDSVDLEGTPAATFDTKNVGTAKAVTVTGYTVSGADSGNYTFSQPSGLTADINPAALEVTAAVKSKGYGDPDPALTSAITGGSLVSGDSLSGSLTRVAGEDVGPYAIQQGGLTAGSNYALSFVSANLTITPRPITVTADPQSKVYGEPDPALTLGITSGSLVDGDFIAGYVIRVPGQNVGSYEIQQGTLTASPNYTLTYVSANLEITSASSVTAIGSSQNPSAAGSSVTFTATVGPVAPAATTPTGHVQFLTNNIPMGSPVSLAGGVATLSTALLPSGNNTVSANYLGDLNYFGSSQSLTQAVAAVVATPTVMGIASGGVGSVTVTFAGTPGAKYIVLATTDLASPGSWQIVSTNTAGTDGQWTFPDSTTAHPFRFYRAATP